MDRRGFYSAELVEVQPLLFSKISQYFNNPLFDQQVDRLENKQEVMKLFDKCPIWGDVGDAVYLLRCFDKKTGAVPIFSYFFGQPSYMARRRYRMRRITK